MTFELIKSFVLSFFDQTHKNIASSDNQDEKTEDTRKPLLFRKGNNYITPLQSGESGGHWKMYHKNTRIGIFDKYLTQKLDK